MRRLSVLRFSEARFLDSHADVVSRGARLRVRVVELKGSRTERGFIDDAIPQLAASVGTVDSKPFDDVPVFHFRGIGRPDEPDESCFRRYNLEIWNGRQSKNEHNIITITFSVIYE